jgi:quaternary ammonium compound-resistance protein SugE
VSAIVQLAVFAVVLDVLGIVLFKRWAARSPDSKRKKVMAWAILIAAGLTEVIWLVALKNSNGFERTWQGALSISLAWASFFMLAYAMKFIPAGTAYAVWTGCGALGGAVAGMMLFGESRSAVRLASLALIVIGIIGVKVTEQGTR